MISSLLLLSLPSALAGDPTILPPSAAPDESHIVEVRHTSDVLGASTMAIVLSCQPLGGELGTKMGYSSPTYVAESAKLAAALTPRSDVQTIVVMNNPSAEEVTTWLKDTASVLNGDTYRMVMISVACPATGGDTDDERLLTREVTDPHVGGLAFADLAAGIAPLTNSSIWLLDASRDISAAAGVPTYGPTADDVAKFTLRDTLGISSGPSGRYAGGGLLEAAADAIAMSKGANLSLEAFFYRGIKMEAPTLEITTSMGLLPNDAWNQNMSRPVFVGGPLITVPVATLPTDGPNVPKKKFPPGCIMAGAGVLSLIGTGITAGAAGNFYDTLVLYNKEGGESQAELDVAANGYRTNTGLAIGLGVLGSAAVIGGTTWTILDHGHTKVEIVPTGNGVMVGGTF